GNGDDPGCLRAGEDIAADRVEDEIDGRNGGFEGNCAAVDRLVCAKLQGPLGIGARGGGDDVSAMPARELHGDVADPAEGTVNQHPLSSGEAAVVEEPLPCAQRRE